MTIRYPDGTVLNALLLSRGSDTIRAAVAGDDDVRTFVLIQGAWTSDQCEPVSLEFAWERCDQPTIPDETEFVCSRDIASKLMSTLFTDSGRYHLAENMIYVFSPDGKRVRIQQSLLNTDPARAGIAAARSMEPGFRAMGSGPFLVPPGKPGEGGKQPRKPCAAGAKVAALRPPGRRARRPLSISSAAR